MSENEFRRTHEQAFEIAKTMPPEMLQAISELISASADPAVVILRTVAELVLNGRPAALIQKDLSILLDSWEQIAKRLPPSDSSGKDRPTRRTGCLEILQRFFR